MTSDGDDGVTRLLGQLQEVIAKRADSLSRFLRPSVQHVAETAVEPCLARCVVMLGVDRFVVDMRKVATEARDEDINAHPTSVAGYTHRSFLLTEAGPFYLQAMTTLRTRQLGLDGPRVFPLGLGCMGMSDMYGPADESESIATIHAALDAGVTLLDTGDYYGAGHNELLIGRALRDRRDKAVLSRQVWGLARAGRQLDRYRYEAGVREELPRLHPQAPRRRSYRHLPPRSSRS